jgi:hypothetical protein
MKIQKQTLKLAPEFIQRLEQVECNYWKQYYRGSEVFPSYISEINGGVACALPELDILAMNRVIGLGLAHPINQQVLDQVISFYRQAGSARFFIQLPPIVMNDELQSLLQKNGFAHHNNWTKLYRKAGTYNITVNPALSIRQIDVGEACTFGELIFMSFDWEDSRLTTWLASTVGLEGYRHYIVSAGNKSIAAGALYLKGEMASMAFAGTLESFRGQGAQSLLLKTRLEDAAKGGAKYITSETAEHREDRPVKSCQNLMRFGFQRAYQRQNWIFHFDD